MGRLLIIFLILVGAGLYFDESRARIVDFVQPALNPAYGWVTRGEMRQMVRDLEDADRMDRFPQAREFDLWMARRYPRLESRRDSWSTPYRLQATGQSFTVISAGPDGVFGTADDLEIVGTRAPRRAR